MSTARRSTRGPASTDGTARPLQVVQPGQPIQRDGWAILRTPFPPQRWIVPGLIPHDFMMLSAPPKAGKSMFALMCALKVATMQLADAAIPAPTVLYISPDDTDQGGIQERINMLLGGVPLDPQRIDFWFEGVGRLDEGLTEQIGSYLTTHPHCVLVVVDVYNSVKPERSSDDIQKHDHSAMRQLAEFSQRQGVGLMLLNHDNKRPKGQGDRMTRISGSYGLVGGVQTIMHLERDDNSANVLLYRRSRRGPDAHIAFSLDELSVEWEPTLLNEPPEELTAKELEAELEAAAQEREADEKRKRPHVPGPIEQRILDALADGKEWKPKDLAVATDARRQTVRWHLRRMLDRKQVALVCGGVYQIAPQTPQTPQTPTRNPGNAAAGNDAALGSPVGSVGAVGAHTDTPSAGPQTPVTPTAVAEALLEPGEELTAEELAELAELEAQEREYMTAPRPAPAIVRPQAEHELYRGVAWYDPTRPDSAASQALDYATYGNMRRAVAWLASAKLRTSYDTGERVISTESQGAIGPADFPAFLQGLYERHCRPHTRAEAERQLTMIAKYLGATEADILAAPPTLD